MQIRPFGHCHKKHKMLKIKYKGHHHGCHYKIKGCPSFLEREMHPDFQKKCHKMKKCHKIGKHHGDPEAGPCFMKRGLKHHDHGLHRGEHGHHHGPHHGGPHGHHHDGPQRGPHGYHHDGPHSLRDGSCHGGPNPGRKNCGCENVNESQHFRGHGKRGGFQRGGRDCGNCSRNEQNNQAVVAPPCCQQRSKSV